MKSETEPRLADAFGGDSELVFWSFRYFLGRMTASTCKFAHRLAANWPRLEASDRVLIQRELEDAFESDDLARATKSPNDRFFPLGNDCDRAAWQLVRDAYNKHPLSQ